MAVACKHSQTVCTCQQSTRPCPALAASWAAFIAGPKGKQLKQRVAELIRSVKEEQQTAL